MEEVVAVDGQEEEVGIERRLLGFFFVNPLKWGLKNLLAGETECVLCVHRYLIMTLLPRSYLAPM